jgi:AraC-like DNA-binding protein
MQYECIDFNRHFLKAFNCSPKKYLTDRKMERAHELLLLDKRPSEIYFDLGYQSLSSFSTEFKKHFGMSPGKYQRKDALTNSH